jgi:hypothetical protein
VAPLSKQPRRSVLILARILTALVSGAAAEGMLWIEGYPSWWAMDPNMGRITPEYQCDQDLGWSARAGSVVFSWPDRPGPIRVTNWSGGRRATSEQEQGQTNRPKVLFFGDSYIQGYGLADMDTLPWMVQKRHPEMEIANYGAGLYGTYQSYLAMAKRVHGPSTVYYLFNGFHEGRNAAEPAFLRVMNRPPQGCFYPYPQPSGGELKPGRSQGEVVWFLSRHLRIVALVQEYKQIIESYWRVRNKRRTTEMLLVKMNELVNAGGGNFTVILFDLDPEERNHYRDFLRAQGINAVDCDRPEMKDTSLRQADRHPSGKLNALLAEWIEPVAAAAPRTVSDTRDHR